MLMLKFNINDKCGDKAEKQNQWHVSLDTAAILSKSFLWLVFNRNFSYSSLYLKTAHHWCYMLNAYDQQQLDMVLF